jgi:hypothetical protein
MMASVVTLLLVVLKIGLRETALLFCVVPPVVYKQHDDAIPVVDTRVRAAVGVYSNHRPTLPSAEAGYENFPHWVRRTT